MFRYISDLLKKKVKDRVNSQCEYCLIDAPFSFFSFHKEHIVSLKHGKKAELYNLAFACPVCNVNKGDSDSNYRKLQKNLLVLLLTLACGSVVAQKKATLLVFFDTECPICQTYSSKLQVFYEKYKTKIQFQIIYSTKNTKQNEVRQFQKEYHLEIPYMIDYQHRLVQKWNATTTPEVVFITPTNEIYYRGAIDNQFIGLGKFRPKTTELFLENALISWLNNQTINPNKTEPIGCLINRK